MLCVAILELIILIITAFLVIIQIYLLRKQIKQQHEERRRENTTQFMATWCNSLKKDTCIAEQVARKLNTDQCQKLYEHQAFDVSDDIKKDICKFCPIDSSHCANCSLKNSKTVDGKILTELRWHVITYLNTLETMLVSWNLGIVDTETIEQQFQFLNDVKKGCTLAEFRHTAGGYPIIEQFIDRIKDSNPKPKNKLK
ncbi:MAG: hypothetical protein IJD64_05160 [Clostridia bacterium]|nr:hypothetical protein [Clostridia bacterium]